MSRAWVRLDNASNIFLAARSDIDPKVFRISAEMDHTVDPEALQAALDETYDRYPLYHAVLRSGVFWHYLQDSTLRPLVAEENLRTCAPLYQPGRRTLLFRVFYYRRRISLEIFHALSDGTGALWFLTDLITRYAGMRTSGEHGIRPDSNPALGLISDSFADYFRTGQSATPLPPADQDQDQRRGPRLGLRDRRVQRVTGTRTPDHRPRLIELTAPASALTARAKQEGASLTTYLTAIFFEAIRASAEEKRTAPTLSASVPVNLRLRFPSDSPRNFFTAVRVAHRYGRGDDSIGAIARDLEQQLSRQSTAESLEQKLRRFTRFERMPALRILPRQVKDAALRLINRVNNRGLSVAVSNLGRVVLPEPAESQVRRMLFHVSAVRPQFCAMSHAGLLTLSFTSPFVETAYVREFVRILTADGLDVTIAATRVTEDELSEAAAHEAAA